MQDTKTKADINLIQFHKITNRHVLALEADITDCSAQINLAGSQKRTG